MLHTLTIKLKQHTPLIHFQHDQYGATLRASEVKPKLDKFIVQNVFGDNFDNVKSSLVGYNAKQPNSLSEKFHDDTFPYRALNYKMKVIVDHSHSNMIAIKPFDLVGNRVNEQFPLLLANMGEKETLEDIRQFSFFKEIIISFTSPLDDLLKDIESWIDLFFATHNFGQRSDKGFGSFTVIAINNESIVFDEYNCLPSTHFIQFPLDGMQEYKKIFDVIDFYWKCLKSGINYTRRSEYPDRYIKSFLWVYLNSHTDHTWEKRAIKEYFALTTEKKVRPNNKTSSFARALLGCPDKFEYNNLCKTVSVSHSLQQKDVNYIARIPSPILFKPVIFPDTNKCRVYILVDKSIVSALDSAVNKTFTFGCNRKELKMDVNTRLIDYDEFISSYHKYLSQDEDVLKALFSKDSRTDYDDNGKNNWFIAINYNWLNVLGRQRTITFGKTRKMDE